MSDKVILISIDGMRPDGVMKCGHSFVKEMMVRCRYSLKACSVKPPVTLPAHTSMFYGAPPVRHGIVTNTYTPPVRPIPGLAEQLSAAGKISAAFYNWEPIRNVWKDGTMAYTYYVEAYREENTDQILTAQACDLIQKRKPDFVFLHLVETDEKGGHDHGWMSEEYLMQLKNAISCVEKIFNSAPDDYSIIVTADHGGHERNHGDDVPEDMTIPMFFKGKAFLPGEESREIGLMDIAPTVAYLTGIAIPKEWEGKVVGKIV